MEGQPFRRGRGALMIVLTWAVLGGLAVGGCAEDDAGDFPTSTGLSVSTAGYAQPIEAVSALLDHLAADRWEDAAAITVEGQMALVALAEGADLEIVADYLRLGEAGVGANFWAGFTQVAEGSFSGSVEELVVISERAYEAGERRFVDYRMALPTSPEDRTFKLTIARSDDLLWQVDVLTTFIDVLAYRLSETAEIARATRSEDARVVSAELARQVASLEAALTDSDLTEESRQGVRSALSAIQ